METLTQKPLYTLLLALADDEFIMGYRNSEWTGIAPMLEEDVAFSSMSQDEIGHARILYEMLAAQTGISADKIAYARRPDEYLNCWLVEHRDMDWGYVIARHFLYDTADHVRLNALLHSSFEPLANACQKIIREEKYHLMHADTWLDRLAEPSGVSRQRLIAALDKQWPHALGIFESLPGEDQLVSEGVLRAHMSDLCPEWLGEIAPYFERLKLPFPAVKNEQTALYTPTIQPIYGGRQGKHTPEFTALWEEMTEVYRLDPEAVW